VCNGENNCIAGRDENYCDQNVSQKKNNYLTRSLTYLLIAMKSYLYTSQICKDGFKCGRQCIPKELVCNGQHDCVDGSDEEYSSCS
jgi:hypothetical protein